MKVPNLGGVIQGGQPMIGGLGVGLGSIPMIGEVVAVNFIFPSAYQLVEVRVGHETMDTLSLCVHGDGL